MGFIFILNRYINQQIQLLLLFLEKLTPLDLLMKRQIPFRLEPLHIWENKLKHFLCLFVIKNDRKVHSSFFLSYINIWEYISMFAILENEWTNFSNFNICLAYIHFLKFNIEEIAVSANKQQICQDLLLLQKRRRTLPLIWQNERFQ